MALSVQEMQEIRDTVYQNPFNLYRASDVLKERTPIRGVNNYCVVHTDGTRAGAAEFRQQGCHARLKRISEFSECIGGQLTLPAVQVYWIDSGNALLDHLKGQGKLEKFIDFLINTSIYRDMFLIKDPDVVLRHGLMVRLDRHPDDVLLASTVCRSMHENINFSYCVTEQDEIPLDLAWCLAGIYDSFNRPVGHNYGHDPIGLFKSFDADNLYEVMRTLVQDYPARIQEDIPLEDTYSWLCTYESGFSRRFLRSRGFRACIGLPRKYENVDGILPSITKIYNDFELRGIYE